MHHYYFIHVIIYILTFMFYIFTYWIAFDINSPPLITQHNMNDLCYYFITAFTTHVTIFLPAIYTK